MQCKIEKDHTSVPIKVELTLETLEDLCELWMRFNLTKAKLNTENAQEIDERVVERLNENANTHRVWLDLDAVLEKYM